MRPWIDEIIETENFLRTQIKAGKSEALRLLAVMLVHKALELRDCSLLNEAEEWHRKASSTGDESRKYFESEWPKIKSDMINRIEMNKIE